MKNGARLFEDDERVFHFNIQAIEDFRVRLLISDGASQDRARKKGDKR
jgi:hypothetical protein